MNQNIETVLNQITEQIEDSPTKNLLAGALKTTVEQQISLEELMLAKQNGELNDTEFETEMEREKQLVEAEMLTWQIAAKADVQKVVNKAFALMKSSLI
ncbi:hypothetical protein AB2S62_18525 [Vibrio sp. NTOU-M3]|uniref:hypothetical protein n=1 Tax=Vibrio sp. NTOU-M3 TaxID=3234954 RepID=UPI00349FB2D9